MCAYKSEYKLTNIKWNDAVAVFISGLQDAGDPWTGASLCLFLAESQRHTSHSHSHSHSHSWWGWW
jgi:hypothetical protein